MNEIKVEEATVDTLGAAIERSQILKGHISPRMFYFVYTCYIILVLCQAAFGVNNVHIKVNSESIEDDPVATLRQVQRICNHLDKYPSFKLLNQKISAARAACKELDFSILDEVEETEDLWQDDEGKEEDSQFLETSTTTKKVGSIHNRRFMQSNLSHYLIKKCKVLGQAVSQQVARLVFASITSVR